MRRIKTNAVLLIVVMLLSIPFGLFSQNASWKAYDGELLAVSYPGDWFCIGGDSTMSMFRKQEEEGKEYDGAVITPIEFDLEKSDRSVLLQSGYIAMMMATLEEKEKKDKEGFESVFKNMESALSDFQRDEIDIDGYTTKTMKGTFKEAPMSVLIALSIVDDYVFLFTGMMPIGSEQNLVATMEKILYSASFLK